MAGFREQIRALLADGTDWRISRLAYALQTQIDGTAAHREWEHATASRRAVEPSADAGMDDDDDDAGVARSGPDLAARLHIGRSRLVTKTITQMLLRGQVERVSRGVYRLAPGQPIESEAVFRRAIERRSQEHHEQEHHEQEEGGVRDSFRMSAEDAEEYTVALGQIMSGGWRQIALAQKIGVPEAIGMTTEAWVRDRIGGYVRLGLDERREAVKELTDPEGQYQLTQRQAAEVLGIGVATVNRDLGDVPDGTGASASLEADGVEHVPDGTADDFDEPTAEADEPSVADVDVELPYAVDPEPPDVVESEPAPPTVGDVREDIRAAFDDEAVQAEMTAAQHVSEMARVRATWLRFVSDRPPGVFAEGLDRGELDRLVRDLDRVSGWVQQARAVAAAALRPRRVV